MRWLLLAVLVSTSACASIRRPHCPSDAPGTAASERDELLAKMLVRSFYTDDFQAYQRLQPTETQYTTLAWRFGGEQADRMMSVIREPNDALAEFEARRAELGAAGIDPRTAERCTRVVGVRGDEPRFYAIRITFTEGTRTMGLSADVFDSDGRASFVGNVAPGTIADLFRELLSIAEGFFAIVFEQGEDPARALPALRAFRDKHLARYQELTEMVRAAVVANPAVTAQAFHEMRQRVLALEVRWESAKTRLSELASNSEFQAILEAFGGGNSEAPELERPPTPE